MEESRSTSTTTSVASTISYVMPELGDEQNLDDEDVFVKKNIEKHDIKKPSNVHQTRVHVRLRRPMGPKYFTKKKVTEDISQDQTYMTPFKYPSSLEEFAHRVMKKAWRDITKVEELKKPVEKKYGMTQKLHNNFAKRMFVQDMPPDSMKTVCDFDKEYHKVVGGRPIMEDFKWRDYIYTAREVLKTKIILGYREDDIMLMNQNQANEEKIVNQVQRNFQRYLNLFEDLLSKDHGTAKELLKESENLSLKIYECSLEYKSLSKKYISMRSALYSSLEKWEYCKMFQKFLFHLSPLHWKQENISQVENYNMVEIAANEREDMFTPDDETSKLAEGTVHDMLAYVHQQCETKPHPKLFFTNAQELLDIFAYMETQNMSYLLHAEALALPLELVRIGMDNATVIFDAQIQKLTQTVNELATEIEWEEKRAVDLEKMTVTLINEDFKELITATDVLNLYVFIEDVYESRIGVNDANLGPLEMMRGIEQKYRDELLNFDKMPQEVIESLEGSCYLEQIRIMRFAEKAAKQYIELEVMGKQLNRSYAPKFEKGRGKEAKNRSKLIVPPKPKPPPPRELTEKEQDYLEFFTEFCRFTDDPRSYGVDPDQASPEDKVVVVDEPNLEDEEPDDSKTKNIPTETVQEKIAMV